MTTSSCCMYQRSEWATGVSTQRYARIIDMASVFFLHFIAYQGGFPLLFLGVCAYSSCLTLRLCVIHLSYHASCRYHMYSSGSQFCLPGNMILFLSYWWIIITLDTYCLSPRLFHILETMSFAYFT